MDLQKLKQRQEERKEREEHLVKILKSALARANRLSNFENNIDLGDLEQVLSEPLCVAYNIGYQTGFLEGQKLEIMENGK